MSACKVPKKGHWHKSKIEDLGSVSEEIVDRTRNRWIGGLD